MTYKVGDKVKVSDVCDEKHLRGRIVSVEEIYEPYALDGGTLTISVDDYNEDVDGGDECYELYPDEIEHIHQWMTIPYVEGYFCFADWCYSCGTLRVGPIREGEDSVSKMYVVDETTSRDGDEVPYVADKYHDEDIKK